MKILVTPTSFLKPQNKKAKALIESFAVKVVYNPFSRPLEPEEIIELLDGVDGYIAGLDYITREVIENAPDTLKVISRYGAGVDRVDLQAAKQRGIRVANTPGTNATAVCELAFALMLSLARSVPMLNNSVKKGEWPRCGGIELKGKTLGIIGFGAIGKNLALRAKAFGMDVMAYDPYFDEAFAAEHEIRRKPLDAVIAGADFLSLHVPLTEQTKYMIGEKAISTMKQGAYIINTARGGLVDEEAAARALRAGRLSGIGLDAYEVEPVTDSPLLELNNAVMMPHAGAHIAEAVAAMGMMATRNLIDILQGKPCKQVIV